MTDTARATRDPALAFDVELAEPPQTVWRALSLPAFREAWLPVHDLALPDPTTIVPGEEIRYCMRDAAPPHLESIVTFRIGPTESGGTRLTIVQDLTDRRLAGATPAPANDDGATLMRAA